jgi:hypothetical protein
VGLIGLDVALAGEQRFPAYLHGIDIDLFKVFSRFRVAGGRLFHVLDIASEDR